MRPSLVLLVLLAPLAATCVEAQSPAGAASRAETCTTGARKLSQNTSISNDEAHEITWRSADCEVRLRFRGKLRFTEDWRSIAGVERGTTFRAAEDGPVDREVEIRTGDDGALRFDYEVEGRDQPMDAEGHAWLESVLLQLFRRSGYAAKERVQWMLRTSGPEGVFAEMAKMDGDYGRHAYSVALLGVSSDAALQARVLDAAAGWSSDYYKSQLLGALTERASDSRVVGAGWNVARTLKSDYYATNGIKRLLAIGEPSDANAEIALAALDRIDSDYYRKELLESISSRAPLEGRMVPLYLRAAERTKSDHYRSEILAALTQRSPLSKEHLLATIRATSTMKSDHYRSQALIRIARRHELKGDVLAAYLSAADAIGSRHYQGEARNAVRRNGQERLISY